MTIQSVVFIAYCYTPFKSVYRQNHSKIYKQPIKTYKTLNFVDFPKKLLQTTDKYDIFKTVKTKKITTEGISMEKITEFFQGLVDFIESMIQTIKDLVKDIRKQNDEG